MLQVNKAEPDEPSGDTPQAAAGYLICESSFVYDKEVCCKRC